MEKSKAKELAEYITEQLAGLEDIRKTPMMGGYIFYYRERIFGGIYGTGFMVKITEASRKYMPDSIACPSYDGEMFSELPERKPKTRKAEKK